MKPHVADYKTRTICVRLEAVDGSSRRFATTPTDLKMSNGTVYLSGSGYEFSGNGSTTSFAASSLDLSGILGNVASKIPQDELASGKWDSSRGYIFATSWNLPIEDEEPIGKYIFGKSEQVDDRYTIQYMSLIDATSQSVGRSVTPQCVATLFDQNIDGTVIPAHASRCTGPRSAPDGPDIADYIVTGTITSVTDQYMFTDSTRPEVSAWFDYGEIRFLTGDNAGLAPIRVKAFTAGGVILLQDALFYLPQPGDEYEMIPGCDKNLDGDCVNKYGNGGNFFGFPHVPAPSEYTQVGRGA